MPQDVEAYLRSLTTSDRVRAAAWDAVHAADDAEAQARLEAILPLSNAVKATLWDARKGITPQPVAAASPEETQPSAVSRFVSNAAERVNPVTMVTGLAQAVAHPVQTMGALAGAQRAQFGKAGEAFQRGGAAGMTEAVGHTLAGALPILGPMAADIGEQAGTGDIAGALGAVVGSVAPVAAAGPVGRAAGRLSGPLQRSAERRVVQALGPTKERFKAIAEKRAPEILQRGLGGSRASLQTQAAAQVKAAGSAIDDVLTKHGDRPVDPAPIVEALEQAKSTFQTTRQIPIADAIKDGLERTPGAKIVGNIVELPVVHEPRAVAQLSQLQQVVNGLGPSARVDQLVAIRRTWDKVVADAGGYGHRARGGIGQPLADVSEAAAKREATKAIRALLDDEVPSLSAVNKEFAFWKDLDSVLRQTLRRTQPHGPSLTGRVREAGGAAAGAVIGATAGGPVGAAVGSLATGALAKAAHAAFTSPRWRLVSARTRARLADALASGDTERVSQALGRVTSVTQERGRMVPVMAEEDRPGRPVLKVRR